MDLVVEDGRHIDSLFESIANVKIEEGEASRETDRQALLSFVEKSVGHGGANELVIATVRDLFCKILEDIINEIGASAKTATASPEDRVRYGGTCARAGFVFFRNREHDAALRQYREAATVFEAGNRVEHPDTASIHSNIGAILLGKSAYDAALEEYRKAHSIFEANLGKEHPRTAISLRDIGRTLSRKKEYHAAEEELSMALAILQKKLGYEHPQTVATKNDVEDLNELLVSQASAKGNG